MKESKALTTENLEDINLTANQLRALHDHILANFDTRREVRTNEEKSPKNAKSMLSCVDLGG